MKNVFFYLIVTVVFFSFSCTTSLKNSSSWAMGNRERLDSMIQEVVSSGSHFNLKKPPIALFDWDDTIMKGDMGDATTFWLAAHDGLRHPGDWAKRNPYLTKEAATDLAKFCPGKKGSFILTSKKPLCTDLILSIYSEGKTLEGKEAWNKSHSDTVEPAYLWAVQFLAGYTEGEVRALAEKVVRENLSHPWGAKQKIGSREVPASVKIYGEQRDLIRDLKENGFDVWIITASAQNLVEVIAERVGISPDHVIGIRMEMDENRRLLDRAQACGTSGKGNVDLITYRKGKRCWVNKVVFGVSDVTEMMNEPSKSAFAAGDSDTDTFFVKDAKYHLVINRNKPELLCHALANKDGHWVVNPMFIEPLAPHKDLYACKSFGIADQKE